MSNFIAEACALESNDVAPECEHRYFATRRETVPPIVTCVRCHEPLPICDDCFQPHGWHLMDCPVPDRERAERKKRRRLCSTWNRQ